MRRCDTDAVQIRRARARAVAAHRSPGVPLLALILPLLLNAACGADLHQEQLPLETPVTAAGHQQVSGASPGGNPASDDDQHHLGASSIFGIVFLCLLLFGCVPALLYYFLYRRGAERRRSSTLTHPPTTRGDVAADLEMLPQVHVPDGAVLCSGVDVVLYSDEEGLGEPHPVRYPQAPPMTNETVRERDLLDSGDEEPEAVPGLAIEARLHPRRRLPKRKVVLKQDSQRIEVTFHEDAHIPQAEPPPLSREEREKLEAELRRVASPIAYGRATYNPAGMVGLLSPSNLTSRNNSPVAFSAGPSPAASLHGSFTSVCRLRQGSVARKPRGGGGGLLSPMGSIGGDGSRPPSRQQFIDSSDDEYPMVDDVHEAEHYRELGWGEGNREGSRWQSAGRVPLARRGRGGTGHSPAPFPRYEAPPLSTSSTSDRVLDPAPLGLSPASGAVSSPPRRQTTSASSSAHSVAQHLPKASAF